MKNLIHFRVLVKTSKKRRDTIQLFHIGSIDWTNSLRECMMLYHGMCEGVYIIKTLEKHIFSSFYSIPKLFGLFFLILIYGLPKNLLSKK